MKIKEIIKFDNETEIILPLFESNVRAGFPSPADNYIEKKIDLNKHLIKHPAATFLVRVEGDSMQDAGIDSGDILVVDRALEPADNKIIIAVINGEFTVKRIKKIKNEIYLVPENKSYPDIKITDDMDFEVWGVVSSIIKEL
jgi:DNA polymerase V